MSRMKLQKQLNILGKKYGFQVYFEPPALMKYPCILYEYNNVHNQRADNKDYIQHMGYQLLYITKESDTTIPRLIANELNYGSMKNVYESDNLYHHVISCYY